MKTDTVVNMFRSQVQLICDYHDDPADDDLLALDDLEDAAKKLGLPGVVLDDIKEAREYLAVYRKESES